MKEDLFSQVFSKSLIVDKVITVDCSGNSGDVGQSGILANNESFINKKKGGIGRPGWNAFHGSDAMNVDLFLAVHGDRLLVYSKGNNIHEVKIYGRLALFESSSSVVIKSMGGNGGRGGDGGDGMDGDDGLDGVPACRYSLGTDGSAGGGGGAGGDGGNGGHGGDGGNVTINISIDDLDALSVIESINCMGGEGGCGGAGGAGGNGGKGGQGGLPYVWTVGRAGETPTTDMIPGGLDGNNGSIGRHGRAGLDGTAGRSGSVEYRVTDKSSNTYSTYSSLFDLSLLPLSHDQFITTTGVFEPGQLVGIRNLRLTNLSAMPSPRPTKGNHGISIRVKHTNMINKGSSEVVLLPISIAYTEVHTIQSIISFRIAHIPCLAIGNSVCESATIELEGYATRFCHPLKGLGNLTHSITVRYPLAISIHGARSSLFGHHLPIVIRVQNISNAAIGSRAEGSPRIARVELSLIISPVSNIGPESSYDSSRIRFIATDNDSASTEEKVFTFSEPITFDILNLDAQSEMYLTGEILVDSESNIKCYQKLNLLASLKIGDLDYPMNASRIRPIQVEAHSFCITQPPSPLSGNDLFLVSNSETTSQEIDKWQTFASLLMLKLNVFDVSYMNGFDYNMPSHNLLQGLSGRVVVILNNGYRRSDDPTYFDTPFYPLYHLSSSAVFEAARRHGVRTYIVNKQPDFEFAKLLYPSKVMDVSASVVYKNRTSLLSKVQGQQQQVWARSEHLAPAYETVAIRANSLQAPSSSEEMNIRAAELQEKLLRMRPDHTHFITVNTFDPEYVKPSSLWILGRYQLGHVTVRRGLDSLNPLVAYRDATRKAIHSSVDIDFFGALKLYPFTFKLSTMITAIARYSATPTTTTSLGGGSGSGMDDNNPLWSKFSSHQYLSVGAQLFCDTILSDLADEIYMIVKHKEVFYNSGMVLYDMCILLPKYLVSSITTLYTVHFYYYFSEVSIKIILSAFHLSLGAGLKLLANAMVDFNSFCSADFSSTYSTELGRRIVLYILRSLYDVLRTDSSYWTCISHPYSSAMLEKLSSFRDKHGIVMSAVDNVKGTGGGGGSSRRRDLDTMLGRLRDPYRCVLTNGFHFHRFISFNTTVPLYAIEPVRDVCGYPSPFEVYTDTDTDTDTAQSLDVQTERRRKAIHVLINALHTAPSPPRRGAGAEGEEGGGGREEGSSKTLSLPAATVTTSTPSLCSSPLSSSTTLSTSSSSSPMDYTVTGKIHGQ